MQKRNRNLLRFGALFFCLLFLFAGCKGSNTEEDSTQPGETNISGGTVDPTEKNIKLPYFEKDALNPYFAASRENRFLAFLYAEPLYRVASNYTARAVLAKDGSSKDKTYTVELQDASFSDGSKLTAADVVYSFQKAKASTWYGARLAKIESARARSNAVEFVLSEPNAYVQNLLTFPILKQGTAETAEGVPVGTGPYILRPNGQTEKNGHNAAAEAATPVSLVTIKDPAHLKNALEIGNVSFLFADFEKGSYERIVAQNTFITMNHLVYLGINHAKPPLNSAALRTAIYYGVDQDGIASSAFQGCAQAAGLPLHPAALEPQGVSAPPTSRNALRALEILSNIGYNRYDKKDILSNGTSSLEMTVLVNEENPFRVATAKHVAKSLSELGMRVSVESVPYDTYAARLHAGDFFLYVGEVKLSEDLDLSTFFVPGGATSFGIAQDLPVCSAASAWHRGESTTAQFAESFLDDMPFVPLCYRSGMAAYEKRLTPDFSVATYDLYGNLAAWKTTG